ncbi:hypothetical protein [Spirosoma spitsbergense]|uniref:hypothetical protein n=1 Tax=Spirosoma spitsbergense TaxID=431554 RepID=UPI000366BFEA|nr:hypothetical protein [Spirosoma spitsbergense]
MGNFVADSVKLIVLTGIFWTLTSCGILRQNDSPLSDKSKYCELAIQYICDTTHLSQVDLGVTLQTDTALTKQYAHHDLVMANALGLLPLLQKLTTTEAQLTDGNPLETISVHQKIISRLLVASAQIASVEAELDCEGERATRLANYLDQRDAVRIRRLTLLSVVIGAATTVATTLLASGNTMKLAGVGGGALGGGFGSWAAFSSNRKI